MNRRDFLNVLAAGAAAGLPLASREALSQGQAATRLYDIARFGNVSVSVTTSAGAISNVQITRVTTSFPVSRIAPLPAQVVQKQTASVNLVSGATYSSQAFRTAVQQALALAQATA